VVLSSLGTSSPAWKRDFEARFLFPITGGHPYAVQCNLKNGSWRAKIFIEQSALKLGLNGTTAARWLHESGVNMCFSPDLCRAGIRRLRIMPCH
jgi:hypothetical protein